MKYFSKILLTAAFILALSGSSVALEGYVVTSGPSEISDIKYTWSSPDDTPYYQDAYGDNPDVGLMVCSESGTPSDKYVGLEYVMNTAGSVENQLVSYDDSNLALADEHVSFNGMNCKKTSLGSFVISPSVLSGTPTTRIAAFPANTYILTSDSVDGSNPSFLPVGTELKGSFSGSVSYSYGSNQVNLNLDSIEVDSDQGLRSFSPDAAGRGITQGRQLVLGVCSDPSGESCPTGVEKVSSASSSTLSRSYNLDIPSEDINDQATYRRYAVANGKSFSSVDVGADLEVSSVSVSRNPVYYSQNQSISFSLRNRGNVPVETGFQVEAEIKRNGDVKDSRMFTVDQDISPGSSYTESYEWEATEHSGDYDIVVKADTGDSINEIDENNNQASTGFRLNPVTFPEVIINGDKVPKDETEFPHTGVPYNLTLVMENSDNDTLSNSQIKLIEKDATNSFIPTQELESGSVTESKTVVTFKTGSNGTASLTVTPRGNVMLSEMYSDLSVQDDINYHLRMTGEQEDGTAFRFIGSDGKIRSYYPMEVESPGEVSGQGESSLPNLNSYAKAAMNRVYNIFSGFWGAVT